MDSFLCNGFLLLNHLLFLDCSALRNPLWYKSSSGTYQIEFFESKGMFTQNLINISTCLTARMETFDNEFEELVQFWFENHTNLTKSEFNNDWIDPYDSIWLKLVSVNIYAMEIFESIVMVAFVNYETAGLFGHYRTLINQLLSHLYGGVSTFLKFSIDVVGTR